MLKKDLRKLYKNKRAELSTIQITEFSNQICKQTLQLLEGLHYKHLNCFLSSKDKKEVQTTKLLESIEKSTKVLSVPISDYKTNTISAALYSTKHELTTDPYGIPFPVHAELTDSKEIDIVICPLLCFDKNGYRTGYGKGMYDRFIDTCKKDVLLIGVSFFNTPEQIDDLNEFDKKLSYVITPQKTFLF